MTDRTIVDPALLHGQAQSAALAALLSRTTSTAAQGRHLVTPATPEHIVMFRRW